MNYPLLLSAASLALLVISTWVGVALRNRSGVPMEDQRAESGPLLGATLTLLFFIVGFSFMMAIGRYDLRKACEQGEAIAIGTEYSRADLLAPRGPLAPAFGSLVTAATAVLQGDMPLASVGLHVDPGPWQCHLFQARAS